MNGILFVHQSELPSAVGVFMTLKQQSSVPMRFGIKYRICIGCS